MNEGLKWFEILKKNQINRTKTAISSKIHDLSSLIEVFFINVRFTFYTLSIATLNVNTRLYSFNVYFFYIYILRMERPYRQLRPYTLMRRVIRTLDNSQLSIAYAETMFISLFWESRVQRHTRSIFRLYF